MPTEGSRGWPLGSRLNGLGRSLAATVTLILVSGCGSQLPTQAATVSGSPVVNVVLAGSLSGHFATCATSVFSSSSGPKRATTLRGTVVDHAGTEIGTSDFGLISSEPLRPGTYSLHPDVSAPSGYQAVGTLTVSPVFGKELPLVTIAQRQGTSMQATFLTVPGSLEVAADGTVTIKADLLDVQATRQTLDHPVISGVWRCGSK